MKLAEHILNIDFKIVFCLFPLLAYSAAILFSVKASLTGD